MLLEFEEYQVPSLVKCLTTLESKRGLLYGVQILQSMASHDQVALASLLEKGVAEFLVRAYELNEIELKSVKI